jgi:hypothetical protein
MPRVRVTREIVVEGEASWVRHVLANSFTNSFENKYLPGDKRVFCTKTITEEVDSHGRIIGDFDLNAD